MTRRIVGYEPRLADHQRHWWRAKRAYEARRTEADPPWRHLSLDEKNVWWLIVGRENQ